MHHHDCGHASWRVSVSSRRDATQRRLRQAAAGGGRRQQAAAGGGSPAAVERMRDQLFSQFENDSKHD